MRPFLVILVFVLITIALIAAVNVVYKSTAGRVRALKHERNHLKSVLNDVERALVMATPDPYVQQALSILYLNDDIDKELER